VGHQLYTPWQQTPTYSILAYFPKSALLKFALVLPALKYRWFNFDSDGNSFKWYFVMWNCCLLWIFYLLFFVSNSNIVRLIEGSCWIRR
jgi:hypothetical protein